MVLARVAALRDFGADPGSALFVLRGVGLVLRFAGPLLVSNRLAEPNHDLMLGSRGDVDGPAR
jgi:hypothetical protein